MKPTPAHPADASLCATHCYIDEATGRLMISGNVGLMDHPLAEQLPLMSEAEYEALLGNLTDHIQVEPVLIWEGNKLDGRHRWRALSQLQRPVWVEFFDGTYAEAVERVISKATARNLNDSQKACAAVNLLEARERAGGTSSTDGSKSRDVVGSLFGVSGRYVQEAKALRDASPKLFADCFAGRIKITQANRELERVQKAKKLKAAAKLVGKARGGDTWTIVEGDCLLEMAKLNDGLARLIVIDPPYNIGIDYGRGADADRLSDLEYLRWFGLVLDECRRLLADDGSIYVIISSRYAAEFDHMMTLTFGRKCRRNSIVWVETFGTYNPHNFTDCYRSILYYTRTADDYVWHGDQILIPSDRQTKYGDNRANAAGKVPSNVWTEFPRIVDNDAERVPGFPTQIPRALVERIIVASSEPGDLVLDCFNGSGTTGDAAIRHRRTYYGIEREPGNAVIARARLAKTDRELREGFDQ